MLGTLVLRRYAPVVRSALGAGRALTHILLTSEGANGRGLDPTLPLAHRAARIKFRFTGAAQSLLAHLLVDTLIIRRTAQTLGTLTISWRTDGIRVLVHHLLQSLAPFRTVLATHGFARRGALVPNSIPWALRGGQAGGQRDIIANLEKTVVLHGNALVAGCAPHSRGALTRVGNTTLSTELGPRLAAPQLAHSPAFKPLSVPRARILVTVPDLKKTIVLHSEALVAGSAPRARRALTGVDNAGFRTEFRSGLATPQLTHCPTLEPLSITGT